MRRRRIHKIGNSLNLKLLYEFLSILSRLTIFCLCTTLFVYLPYWLFIYISILSIYLSIHNVYLSIYAFAWPLKFKFIDSLNASALHSVRPQGEGEKERERDRGRLGEFSGTVTFSKWPLFLSLSLFLFPLMK